MVARVTYFGLKECHNVAADTLVMLCHSTQRTELMLPLVIFIGVNHHTKMVILGSGLLVAETVDTYSWILHTFLEAMHGKCPISVVTDDDKAISKAIRYEALTSKCSKMSYYASVSTDGYKQANVVIEKLAIQMKRLLPLSSKTTYENVHRTRKVSSVRVKDPVIAATKRAVVIHKHAKKKPTIKAIGLTSAMPIWKGSYRHFVKAFIGPVIGERAVLNPSSGAITFYGTMLTSRVTIPIQLFIAQFLVDIDPNRCLARSSVPRHFCSSELWSKTAPVMNWSQANKVVKVA
ncbi:hypothetical protein Ddye_008361 [Dipteronia dyeriana]|uniref:MULE transposase domain-containing protein n=1 Tax=Dipteronia dyeriana TaxID=168575 RepID=A0AAD9X9E4_9ROSI|nr:hypothetical protein Ddye_008361 [Dipteronia dyeriana]